MQWSDVDLWQIIGLNLRMGDSIRTDGRTDGRTSGEGISSCMELILSLIWASPKVGWVWAVSGLIHVKFPRMIAKLIILIQSSMY